MTSDNFVGKLKEYADKRRLTLVFEEVGYSGYDHIRTFTIRAVLDGKSYPEGVGSNKRKAKKKAAENALIDLERDHTDTAENVSQASTSTVHPAVPNKYMSWLDVYVQKETLTLKAVEEARLGPNRTTQWCYFVVGDKEYPGAYGQTQEEAKEEAAKQVYNEICDCKTAESGDEKISDTATQPKQDLNQAVPDAGGRRKSLRATYFIGLIDDYCKKVGCLHSFVEDKRCGPPHDPQFFYKVKIKDKVYPVGVGKTIKDARHHAAELAWEALQEQSDWDSKEAKSALSDAGAAAKLSKSLSMQDSGCAKTSKPGTSTDSDAFTNSSKPLKEQDKSPIVKPKIKIAANFNNALRDSKEIIMPDFKRNNADNIERVKTSTQSGDSRFTSEFDSIERLGKGGFGHVFKARHKLVETDFAIKIVRCKEITTALREAAVLSDLQHPNIVRYYNCWLENSDYQLESSSGSYGSSQSSGEYTGKYLFIQMEMCEVRTLRVWIDEKNVQNQKKSLRDWKRKNDSLTFALQIVSGVEYIHSKSLFHRDLKPANIMFGRDGEVKIGDFGLVAIESYDTDNLVERSKYRGTPTYMAPEQKIKTTYDRKVDIFALGLIYFELLWNVSTGHERAVIWEDARKQKLPQAFCQHFRQESLFINSMLREKPEDRPEASQLKTKLAKYRNESEAHEQRTC